MIDGLLLVDKPEGPTSHDVVASVRRALGGTRCGHSGTLDPFATGLLVLAVGRATRLLRFLAGSDKTYEGLVRLGWATTTDDRTGQLLGDLLPVDVSEEALAHAAAQLEGERFQLPPAFSARKHEGVPHYRLARRGHSAPLKEVPVRVHWLVCERASADTVLLRVVVSAGTYIRALARDLGARLGCGGHLAELRRLSAGPFQLEAALPIRAARPLHPDPEALRAALVPIDAIPLGLPGRTVTAEEARAVRSGARIPLTVSAGDPAVDGAGAPLPASGGTLAPGSGPWVRLLDEGGRLLAVAEIAAGPPPARPAYLQPRIVL